jgi:hypothetical protein
MTTQSAAVYDESFIAENDLSTTGQFRFVELSGADTVDVCDGATDRPIGVLLNKPKTGEPAAVRVLGIAKVIAGAELASRMLTIGTDNQGRAVSKTSDADLVAGYNLDTAGAAGDIVRVLLTPGAQRAA